MILNKLTIFDKQKIYYEKPLPPYLYFIVPSKFM